MKHFILYLVAFGLFGIDLIFPQALLACSGGLERGDLQENLSHADIVVKATVIETDAAQNNAVLKVQKYLAGGLRAEHIILYYIDPSLAAVYHLGYDTGCLYGGGNYDGNPSPHVGMAGYFALQRLDNGAYDYVSANGPSYIESEEPAAFESLVAELRDEEATVPAAGQVPPVNPLRITTSSGQQYMLPVDGGPLVPYVLDALVSDWAHYAYANIFSPVPACSEAGCRLYAPDRSLFGDVGEDNTISFDYHYYSYRTDDGEGFLAIEVEGQAFSFSPTGQALVVWNDNQMAVYRVSTTMCNCLFAPAVPSLSLTVDVTLTTFNQEVMARPWEMIRWSADGSTLAYSDLAGLWLIDVFRQGEPEQIARGSGGAMALPVFLSHTGRYIGYTVDAEARNWTTVDRLGGEIFINALPSPNELYMAYFSEPQGIFAPRPDSLDSQCYYLPCSTSQRPHPDEFLWIEQAGRTYALTVRCGDNRIPSYNDAEANCSLESPVFGHRGVESYQHLFRAAEDFIGDVAYEPHRGSLAYVTGPHTLKIFPVEYDLSDQIEGTIVDIAWLPSLFYYYPTS